MGRKEVTGTPGQATSAPAPSGHIWQVLLPSVPSTPPSQASQHPSPSPSFLGHLLHCHLWFPTPECAGRQPSLRHMQVWDLAFGDLFISVKRL